MVSAECSTLSPDSPRSVFACLTQRRFSTPSGSNNFYPLAARASRRFEPLRALPAPRDFCKVHSRPKVLPQFLLVPLPVNSFLFLQAFSENFLHESPRVVPSPYSSPIPFPLVFLSSETKLPSPLQLRELTKTKVGFEYGWPQMGALAV